MTPSLKLYFFNFSNLCLGVVDVKIENVVDGLRQRIRGKGLQVLDNVHGLSGRIGIIYLALLLKFSEVSKILCDWLEKRAIELRSVISEQFHLGLETRIVDAVHGK